MTTAEFDLQSLLNDVFIYYFKNITNVTEPCKKIEKSLFFLNEINTYLISIQKQKDKDTLINLYNKWSLDHIFVRNCIIDIIKSVYVNKVDSLDQFSRNYYIFQRKNKSFMNIFSPFEKTLNYYATVLDRYNIKLQKTITYEWKNSFTSNQLIEIANHEVEQFPNFSIHIALFIEVVNSTVFYNTYVNGINKKVIHFIKNKWKSNESDDSSKNIKNKLEIIWNTYHFFEIDLLIYKQYFYADYLKLYEAFEEDVFTTKYVTKYDTLLSPIDEFFTIQWCNLNNTGTYKKWIDLVLRNKEKVNWVFVTTQYYIFLKDHFYYFTQSLQNEITHDDSIRFLENILYEIFPFNFKTTPHYILSNFYSSIELFITGYLKESCEELFFIYLSKLRKKPIILHKNRFIINSLMIIMNNTLNYSNFITKYDIIFQKQIFNLFYNSYKHNYHLLHYLEFERDMISEIEKLPNSNIWFDHKSKWNKMINEIQESEQFTSTISLIDDSLLPCNIFIGTYGFYNHIDKDFGIDKEHVFYSEWTQINSFYPVIHEKKNIKLLYNCSTAEIEIGGITLLCSMDVTDILLKWQQLWDKGKSVTINSPIEKKIVDTLIPYKILEYTEDTILLCEEDSIVYEDEIKLLIYKKDEIIEEKKEPLHIRIFEENQHYQCVIMRYCKLHKTVQNEDLWNHISNYTKTSLNTEADKTIYKVAIDKLCDSEYIVKNENIIEYV
jgi:hypothetical protein